MMSKSSQLIQKLKERFPALTETMTQALDEISLEVSPESLQDVCLALRDEKDFRLECLMDLCVVDYSDYGISEWTTERSTLTGFERGVDSSRDQQMIPSWSKPRFAVVYHLLSIAHNHRLRIKTFLSGELPQVPSVITIWPAANWYEREAFDLYGVVFEGHPDLRRLLTDYGFVGHPFRKDFPLTGHVEVRYDADAGRVIYQPVTVPARTLVPKTIRKANTEIPLTPSEPEIN